MAAARGALLIWIARHCRHGVAQATLIYWARRSTGRCTDDHARAHKRATTTLGRLVSWVGWCWLPSRSASCHAVFSSKVSGPFSVSRRPHRSLLDLHLPPMRIRATRHTAARARCSLGAECL